MDKREKMKEDWQYAKAVTPQISDIFKLRTLFQIIRLAMLLLYIMALFFTLIYTVKYFNNFNSVNPSIGNESHNFKKHVKEISTALKSAEKLSRDLKQRIDNNNTILANLKKDRETYEQVSKLQKDQIKAIATQLLKEARKDNAESFRNNLFVNAFFFILGLASPFFLGQIRQYWRRYRSRRSINS